MVCVCIDVACIDLKALKAIAYMIAVAPKYAKAKSVVIDTYNYNDSHRPGLSSRRKTRANVWASSGLASIERPLDAYAWRKSTPKQIGDNIRRLLNLPPEASQSFLDTKTGSNPRTIREQLPGRGWTAQDFRTIEATPELLTLWEEKLRDDKKNKGKKEQKDEEQKDEEGKEADKQSGEKKEQKNRRTKKNTGKTVKKDAGKKEEKEAAKEEEQKDKEEEQKDKEEEQKEEDDTTRRKFLLLPAGLRAILYETGLGAPGFGSYLPTDIPPIEECRLTRYAADLGEKVKGCRIDASRSDTETAHPLAPGQPERGAALYLAALRQLHNP